MIISIIVDHARVMVGVRVAVRVRVGVRIRVRPDQFDFREHGCFSKFEGSVGQKKRKIKNVPNFLRWP